MCLNLSGNINLLSVHIYYIFLLIFIFYLMLLILLLVRFFVLFCIIKYVSTIYPLPPALNITVFSLGFSSLHLFSYNIFLRFYSPLILDNPVNFL